MAKPWRDAPMMKPETFTMADIDVPVELRATLEQKRVDEIAVSMLATSARKTPILMRGDGAVSCSLKARTGWWKPAELWRKDYSLFFVNARKH